MKDFVAVVVSVEYLIDELLCPRGFWSPDSDVRSWSSRHEIARVGEPG